MKSKKGRPRQRDGFATGYCIMLCTWKGLTDWTRAVKILTLHSDQWDWHWQEWDSFYGRVGQLSLSVFYQILLNLRSEDRPGRVVWLKKKVLQKWE